MNFFSIKIATKTLEQGGIIAYPTEAVFGLGCDPLDEQALEKLLQIKRRSPQKGLILIASDYHQLLPFLGDIDTASFNRVMESWPGATTWLLPANPLASSLLRGNSELQAVRVSKHPVVKALCDAFGGAIVSTSANTNKRPPARSALAVRAQFGDKIDYIIQANVGELKKPSVIKNAMTGEIIRPA